MSFLRSPLQLPNEELYDIIQEKPPLKVRAERIQQNRQNSASGPLPTRPPRSTRPVVSKAGEMQELSVQSRFLVYPSGLIHDLLS